VVLAVADHIAVVGLAVAIWSDCLGGRRMLGFGDFLGHRFDGVFGFGCVFVVVEVRRVGADQLRTFYL